MFQCRAQYWDGTLFLLRLFEGHCGICQRLNSVQFVQLQFNYMHSVHPAKMDGLCENQSCERGTDCYGLPLSHLAGCLTVRQPQCSICTGRGAQQPGEIPRTIGQRVSAGYSKLPGQRGRSAAKMAVRSRVCRWSFRPSDWASFVIA
jgi:hypothetical protein